MNRGQVVEAVALLNIMLEDDRDDLDAAFTRLSEFVPEYTPPTVYEDFKAQDRDPAEVPFFTEGYLYPLMGKEDARSILGLIRNVQKVLYGEDYWERDFAV